MRQFTKYPSTRVNASKSSKVDLLNKYLDTDTWIKARISEKAYFKNGYKNDIYWIKLLDIGEEDGTYVLNKVSAYKPYKGNKAQRQASLTKTYTVDKDKITVLDPVETATDDDIFGEAKLSKAQINEIYEYLDDTFYSADYNQAVENVAEEFGLSKSQADWIVWNWTIEVKDEYEDDGE